jgi:two-component system, OmpR family, sensor histidine kinase BaeS
MLMLACVGVALLGIAGLACATVVTSESDVHSLVSRRQVAVDHAGAAIVGALRKHSRSWRTFPLGPVLNLADQAGVAIRIQDRAGHVVGASPGFGSLSSRGESRKPVVVDGHRVGDVILRSSGEGSVAEGELLSDLLHAVAWAAGLTAVLATCIAIGIAHRIAEPARRLAQVARARGSGEREARVGPVKGADEFRDLAASFDQMADSQDRQETLRRNLIADISHELRTPAAVLVAGHEALLDRVEEPTAGQLASLRDEAVRLSGMIDDLQRLSAAEAASLDLATTPCDLATIAAGTADTLIGSFTKVGISLTLRLQAVRMTGSPARLHEVIGNLLTNALKYTPAGGSVTLEVAPQGGSALLRVTDTGQGISPEDLPKIFDRFFRGQQAINVAGGTGIGMTVVAALVQAHNGDIEVSSQPGQGTEITITFPASAGRTPDLR